MGQQLEQDIKTMTVTQLLTSDTVKAVCEEPDNKERVLLQAVLLARAKELGMVTAVKKVLEEWDESERESQRTPYNPYGILLDCDGKGRPLTTIENFLRIMHCDDFFATLKFNTLSICPEKIVDGVTVKWTDTDDAAAKQHIESEYKLYDDCKYNNAMLIILREREYHPVRDIVDNLSWDGTPRIETLLIKWLKCEDTPYSREVSRLIFSGGINRLYNPGCKFDDVPVLIGTKQGEGKSTFVRWLAINDKFFSDVTEIEGQKGVESVEGAWICEIGELLALTRAKEVEAVKSYITKQVFRYRMPYDRRVSDHPRQCIFIGTTNREQFLTDKTGNRRFYPVKINQNGYELFNHEMEVRAEILQCWAEAKSKYDAGEMLPYANRELVSHFKEAQASAVEDDYREGMIRDYLEDRDEVCIIQIWKNALKEFGSPTRKDSQDVALILQSMDGWEKMSKPKRFEEYGVQKYWKRTVSTIQPELDTPPFEKTLVTNFGKNQS